MNTRVKSVLAAAVLASLSASVWAAPFFNVEIVAKLDSDQDIPANWKANLSAPAGSLIDVRVDIQLITTSTTVDGKTVGPDNAVRSPNAGAATLQPGVTDRWVMVPQTSTGATVSAFIANLKQGAATDATFTFLTPANNVVFSSAFQGLTASPSDPGYLATAANGIGKDLTSIYAKVTNPGTVVPAGVDGNWWTLYTAKATVAGTNGSTNTLKFDFGTGTNITSTTGIFSASVDVYQKNGTTVVSTTNPLSISSRPAGETTGSLLPFLDQSRFLTLTVGTAGTDIIFANLSPSTSNAAGGKGTVAKFRAGQGPTTPTFGPWRVATANEAAGNTPPLFSGFNAPHPKLISDAVDLNGIAEGTLYVLQMSYDPGAFPTPAAETEAANKGYIQLATLDVTTDPVNPTWKPAKAAPLSSLEFGDYAVLHPSAMPAVGTWGVDTASHVVWQVVDHNSQFAVVPEPATIGLLGLSALGLTMRRRRHAA